MTKKRKTATIPPPSTDAEADDIARGIRETIALEKKRGAVFYDYTPRTKARESVLWRLRRLGCIEDAEYRAGILYGMLYEIAHFEGRYPCALAQRSMVSERGDAAMNSVARAQRLAIGDPLLIRVVSLICGEDVYPWNQTSLAALKDGLGRLQKYYFHGRRRLTPYPLAANT